MRKIEFYPKSALALSCVKKVEIRGTLGAEYVAVEWGDGSEAIFPNEWLRAEAEKVGSVIASRGEGR